MTKIGIVTSRYCQNNMQQKYTLRDNKRMKMNVSIRRENQKNSKVK